MEESLSRQRMWWALAPLTVVAWAWLAVPVWAQDGVPDLPDAFYLSTALAWLVPIGLGALACGTVPPERAPAVMRVGWLAVGLSVIGYWLCGFAFQFGGLGFVSAHPDLAGLAREWTFAGLEGTSGGGWGVIGLEGFLLQGAAGTPAALRLFWTQLPWITTAVALFLWSLQGRVWPLCPALRRGTGGLGVLLVLGGLIQALLYTLVGNWTWGGGWLANLGLNLGMGHGFVDLAGGGGVHLLAAASALTGLAALPMRPNAWAARRLGAAQQLALPTLYEPETSGSDVRWTTRDEPYVPMPTLHLPVLATVGAWLALLGWVGWCVATPLHAIGGAGLPRFEAAIGLLLAAAGGALGALFSSWLTTGEGNSLMTARGVVGALVAVSAGLPFYPLWAALAVGAGAGLLVPVVQYTVDHLLRLHDPTSAVAVHGVPAFWGLLAVGLFAGGSAGAGWNAVGAASYLGVEGQGVSGYLVSPGFASDWPGQFQAQALGAATIVAAALLANGLLIGVLRGLVRAWYGKGAVRQVARPARVKRARERRVRPKRSRKVQRERRWPAVPRFAMAWLRRREAARARGEGAEAGRVEDGAEGVDLGEGEAGEPRAGSER